jgi:signal transduction histidine kinase/predicted metal-dependent phosphoesterase TrpH
MKKWLLSDLHIHSTFSDGSVQIDEIVKIYGEAGFDVIAVTDHLFDTQSSISLALREEGKSVKDVEAYFQKIKEVSLWAKETYGLLVIPGLEICNLAEDYHILGIDLSKAVNPDQGASGVIKEIHDQGGLAIASHPQVKLSYFLKRDNESIQRHPLHLWKHREKYVDKIDAWEIANRDDLFDRVGLEGLPYIACSDFHDREHLSSWKSLIFSEKETEAIKAAIRERKLSIFYFHEKTKDRKRVNMEVEKEGNASPGSSDSMGRHKILVVDDERDLVELMVYHLAAKGYTVLTAFNGLEAWEKIQKEKPDAIVLDLMMPDLDGWDLCQIIRRSENEGIRTMGILILSARAMAEDRVYGLEMGADDYLTKPFSLHELVLRVEKLTEKRIHITQLRQEWESLRSSIEKKESNLRSVVHDLKSPLISMGFSARRLMRRNFNEEGKSELQIIFDNSLQLTQWIDKTFLTDNGEPFVHRDQMEEVDVRSLISKTIDLLKDVASEKKIEIEVSLSPTIPKIRCQESMMLRALVNLLSNALKFTPPHGQVAISAMAHLDQPGTGVLEISIKDSGTGIHEEDLPNIFLPYYRGKNVHTEEGKGLGLSFVKEVVDRHGGKILVQSEPNSGSLFSILLPMRSFPEELVQKAP